MLQTLYNQSAQQILMQGEMPPPASNTTYLPPAHENLQKLLSELSNVQTSSLGMMAHHQFQKEVKKNGTINGTFNILPNK